MHTHTHTHTNESMGHLSEKSWVKIPSHFSSNSCRAKCWLHANSCGYIITSSPLMFLYRTHFPRRGRQYSSKYCSANSTPWPFPNLPCVSVAVITWTECRSISSHSFGSFVIWFLGHQAPPCRSVRRLKQIKSKLHNVFFIPIFSSQLRKHQLFNYRYIFFI